MIENCDCDRMLVVVTTTFQKQMVCDSKQSAIYAHNRARSLESLEPCTTSTATACEGSSSMRCTSQKLKTFKREGFYLQELFPNIFNQELSFWYAGNGPWSILPFFPKEPFDQQIQKVGLSR